MCGIAGIFGYRSGLWPGARELVEAMCDALAHRGPDGAGLHVDGPVVLGHRRLSILDLSSTGAQPMASASGRSWITYNGEAYDHGPLRRSLAEGGVRFRGTSDTETLVNLLELRGPDALDGVSGIFALAVWDAPGRRLLLARDPLGVKQLYYHDDGERVIFASEIKALLLDRTLPREADTRAIDDYLHFHAPLFERTFFRGVRQVLPGEVVEVTARGLRSWRYARPLVGATERRTPEQAVIELRETLGSVVKSQLLSDVPVGSFLSGGIDSSAVAAFAKRSGNPARCFGVHFTDQGVIDERPYQEAVARSLGVELELVTLDGSSFADDLQRLLYFQDQPVIGSAMIPMFHVSRLAASRVKVCLGGQAGDEVFGGYARYALVHPGRVLRSWIARRLSRRGSGVASGPRSGNLGKQLFDRRNLERLAGLARHGRDWRSRYFENFCKVPARVWRRIFPFSSRRGARATFDETLDRSPARDPADKILHWDVQTYLTGLFQQDDRMSMANSLESRVPLADPRVVRFAFTCDFDVKVREGSTKWLFRRAIADLVPAEILTRRKVGFDTPAERWMRGPQADFVRDLLTSERARGRPYLDGAEVVRALDRDGDPLWFDVVWKLACIEAWARTFLDEGGLAAWQPRVRREVVHAS